MRIRIAALSIILLLGFRAFSQQTPVSQQGPVAQQRPVADHHQHLGSPEIVKLAATSTRPPVPISAKDVVALLDAAGIQRALVFSAAYVYGSPVRTVEDEYAKVRAENDWTGAQAALYPKRLRAFCSFNPLKDYALAELERCARLCCKSRGTDG
jgi:predicted TIM-barrel fold metal-dependent hydrolase